MRQKDWREQGQDDIIEFDVHCVMKKCWANEFLSLLAEMERLGNIGCSRIRGLYCDGDGDFRPKFTNNFKEFHETKPLVHKNDKDVLFWDAG